ncbi:MAG: hypothetical protein KDA41_08960, partial [Planctomycetales bacterium]|nr:hypothetical protein [Planctomycetales bacterium]
MLTIASAICSAPARADDAKPAGPKITYDEHVRPILRQHCFTCHSQDKKESGLALDNYGAVMEGGSSGEIVFGGDLDSSRLWSLVNHDEEPFMPPKQDRLAEEKLAILRQWIEQGALENSGSTAVVKKKPSLAFSSGGGGVKPGEAPLPESLWKQPIVYTQRPAAITALAASPGAPLIALAGQRQIVLYHSETGQTLGVLPFLEGVPQVLRFSRNGALLLAGGGRDAERGIAAVYDVKSGRRVLTVGDELDTVLAADINDSHTRIALGGPQKVVRVYDTKTGELVQTLRKHTDWIYDIRYSPDGVLLATCDRSAGLIVWEAESGGEYLDLRGHSGAVTAVSWRPDSNVLASGSEDGTVKLWEMNNGAAIKSWAAHGGGCLTVDYGRDGSL